MADADAGAVIRLTRQLRGLDKNRGYSVLIDGNRAGQIRQGQTIEFPVVSGPHTVVLRAAYCKSPEVAVDVEPREVVGLLCAADGSASGRVRSAFLFGHAVQVNIQLTRE
jgi:hypothetical protein